MFDFHEYFASYICQAVVPVYRASVAVFRATYVSLIISAVWEWCRLVALLSSIIVIILVYFYSVWTQDLALFTRLTFLPWLSYSLFILWQLHLLCNPVCPGLQVDIFSDICASGSCCSSLIDWYTLNGPQPWPENQLSVTCASLFFLWNDRHWHKEVFSHY